MNERCSRPEGCEASAGEVESRCIAVNPDESEVRKLSEGGLSVTAQAESGVNKHRAWHLDRGSQESQDTIRHDRYVTLGGSHRSVQLQVRTRIASATMVPPVMASDTSRTARSRNACRVAREGAVIIAMGYLLLDPRRSMSISCGMKQSVRS